MDTLSILTEQVRHMGVAIIALLPGLAIALVVLLLTWAVSRSASSIALRLTANLRMAANLRGLLETFTGIMIWVAGVLLALMVLLPGFTPSSLIAGLGLTTVAVGFAFKDIFENFLAGVIIMLRNKMRIGDTISCNGITGKIEHISLRETNIRRGGEELVIVPNSMLFKNPVEVLTNRQLRRHQMEVAIAPDARIEQTCARLISAIEAVDGVSADKPVKALSTGFGDGSIALTLSWYTAARSAETAEIRDAVVRAVQPVIRKLQAEPLIEGAPARRVKLTGTKA